MGFYNNLCPGCMNEVGDSDKCPYCGFDMHSEQSAPYLPYGTVLAGRYVIGDILENNSEGVTYLGLDTITNNCVRVREFLPVALCAREQGDTKISNAFNADEFRQYKEDFLNLWHNIMKLKSLDFVISVLEVFEANDTAYAVAEADGSQTLTDFIEEKGGILSWDVITEKIFPVLDALQLLNDAGVIHGAVSPDTLFLCGNGKFKLWGFSIAAARKTGSSLLPDIRSGYASIEQYANSMTLSKSTDVYGFTAVLYKCITGTAPVDAEIRSAHDTLSIPATYARELPDYVLAAFIGALQIKPEDRTSSIGMLKYSFTKEAYEKQKKQMSAAATASLIDPISDIDDDEPVIEAPAKPVVVTVAPEVPVLKDKNAKTGAISATSTIVMSACIVFVMIIFFVCLSLLGVVSFNFGSGSTSKVVEMPDFSNYMKDDPYIVEVANSYGLKIRLEPDSSDYYAEGVIFEQNVAPGTRIARGSSVILTYSKGYSTVTLPNFVGSPFTETVYYLGKLNLSYNIVEKQNPGGNQAGHVASMTPAAGSVVLEGTEITIEIWGDAPANGSVVGPDTGSSITSSSSVIDSVFGSLGDSVSGLGDTIAGLFG